MHAFLFPGQEVVHSTPSGNIRQPESREFWQSPSLVPVWHVSMWHNRLLEHLQDIVQKTSTVSFRLMAKAACWLDLWLKF